MELLRRFLLVVFTLATLVVLFEPAPVLYLAEIPDFHRELKNHPFPWAHKNESWKEFRDKEITGRLFHLPADQHSRIRKAIHAEAHGYLRSNEIGFSSYFSRSGEQTFEIYLSPPDASSSPLLRVRRLQPQGYAFSQAPFEYRHTYALWGIPLSLAGICAYVFIPRRKYSDNTLHYGAGFAAVVGPDFVGLFMVVGFFALGLLVGLGGASGGLTTLHDSNYLIVSAILWSFCLFGIYMLKIGADYAASGLKCDRDYLLRFKPSGTETAAYDEIASARLTRWKASKWVSRMGVLVSLLSWRAAGPTLLNASRNDEQLEIRLKDGRIWRFMLTGAKNLSSVRACLSDKGIKW